MKSRNQLWDLPWRAAHNGQVLVSCSFKLMIQPFWRVSTWMSETVVLNTMSMIVIGALKQYQVQVEAWTSSRTSRPFIKYFASNSPEAASAYQLIFDVSFPSRSSSTRRSAIIHRLFILDLTIDFDLFQLLELWYLPFFKLKYLPISSLSSWASLASSSSSFRCSVCSEISSVLLLNLYENVVDIHMRLKLVKYWLSISLINLTDGQTSNSCIAKFKCSRSRYSLIITPSALLTMTRIALLFDNCWLMNKQIF